MKLESGDFCPLIGGPCKKFECKWWIQVKGTNPNTGQEVDEWDCTVSFLPFLILEASQQARQAGAAVESFRNESVKQNESIHQNLIEAQKIVPEMIRQALNTKKILESGQ